MNIIRQKDIRHVRLQFLDKAGNSKSIIVPSSSIEILLNNQIAFGGISLDSFSKEIETEIYLIPILETFRELDFKETNIYGTINFLCDAKLATGEFISIAPRNVNNKYKKINEGDSNE